MYCGKFKNFLQREFLDRRISFGEPRIARMSQIRVSQKYRRRTLTEIVWNSLQPEPRTSRTDYRWAPNTDAPRLTQHPCYQRNP